MTFLELCQMTARQTGTIQGVLPTTVTGQINRLRQIVEYVAEAYLDIQNAHRMWRWMQGQFYGDIAIGTQFYAGTYFSDQTTLTPITRFSQWGFKADGSDLGLSMYPPSQNILAFVPGTMGTFHVGDSLAGFTSGATGTVARVGVNYIEVSNVIGSFAVGESVVTPSFESGTCASWTVSSGGAQEEGPLRWLDWDRFYETQLRGIRAPGKPTFYSLTPDNRLVLSPIPNAIYTIRGKYRRSSQTLAADADVPEMPADFHTIIKDAALCYIEAFDEGPRIPVYRLRMLPNWSMLESHQLPKVSWGSPLA